MQNYRTYLPLVLVAVMILISFWIIKPLLVAIFLGALLAYVCSPAYEFIYLKTKNKTFSALLICILVLLILTVTGIFFVNSLIKESYVLFITVKQRIAVGIFHNCKNEFCTSLKDILNTPEIGTQIKEFSQTGTDWIINKGTTFLFSLPGLLLNLLVIFFTMFYFLKDGRILLEKIQQIISMQQHRYVYLLKRLKEILHATVYGYFLIAFIQGALGALGFYLFGVSSPIFWGIVIIFLALIPYVGTGLVWIPASLIIIMDGIFQNTPSAVWKGLGLFLYSVLFVVGIDHVFKSKLVGDKAKIHPAIIFLGTVGGVLVFGLVGILLGPLLLSMTIVLAETYFLPNR